MATIYYWRGAVGDKAFLDAHEEAIQKLINHTYAPGDLEMLKGHRDIFSYRLNKQSRLLLTTIDMNGHRYLLLLEHLPTHDYQKSRFLRSGVLTRYLLAHKDEMAAAALQFAPVEGIPEGLQGLGEEGEPSIALDYYHQEFIQLSDVQHDALQVPLPVVISGLAGSGKSCVAMALLSDFVRTHQSLVDDEPRCCLYVTESPELAHTMQREWEKLPVAQDMPQGITVHFKSYDELLMECAELHDKRLVDGTDFETWYLDFKKHQRSVGKARATKAPDLDSNTAYQECRICSAYTEIEYCNLGERQSLLPKGPERLAFYKTYQTYLAHLEGTRCIHPPFHTMAQRHQYDLVVVDESQDLSHLQLKNLAMLAKQQHVAFCMDSHQSLRDVLSKRPFLLEMLKALNTNLSHIELPITYRCPLKIVRAARALIQAKYHVTGGIADKREAATIVSHMGQGAGHVVVIDPSALAAWDWLKTQALGAHFAVVTSPEFVEEASGLFSKDRVFTPDEIKGLEYDTVLAYRPFSSRRMIEASRRMEGFDDEAHAEHRPKAGVGDDAFAPDFNKLFTSVTRAKRTLVIGEESTRNTALFLKPMQDIMGDTSLRDAERLQDTTARDWEIEILSHVDHGHMPRASDIYCAKFKQNNDAFAAFVAKHRQKAPANARPIATPLATAAQDPFPVEKVTIQPAKSPTTTKKMSPPGSKKKLSETPAVVAAPPSREAAQALALLHDYSGRRLKIVLSIMDFDMCWFQTPIQFEGQTLPLIQHFMRSTEKAAYFTDFFIENPDVRARINTTKILKTLQAQDKTLNPKAKIAFIKMLLVHNLDLLTNGYVLDGLKIALKDDGSDGIEHALLYWLTKEDWGRVILQRLADKFPKLLDLIPPESWAIASLPDANATPLYWLAARMTGLVFLKTMLKRKPDILAAIPAVAWALPLTAEAGKEANISPLYWIAASKEGRGLLKTILEKRTDILGAIPTTAWALPLSEKAGVYANISPLYCLTVTPEGRDLLTTMLEKIPDVLAAIPAAAWALARTAAAGADANNSPLYCLTTDLEGHAFLKTTLEKRPDILAAIPPAAWALPLTVAAGAYANTSALSWLAAGPEGRALFKTMLEKTPDILAAIPAAAWALPLTVAAGAHFNISPLHWLAGTPAGREFLKTILEKIPGILDAIPAFAWARPLTVAAGKFTNISPLYWLAESEEGCEFLKTLLEKKPDIIAAIPAVAWARPRTAEAGESANISPLHWLAANKKGREFLKIMLEKMPNMIAAIPLTAATSEDASTPFLKTLSKTPEGRTILPTLKEILNDKSDIVTIIDELMLFTGDSETTGAQASEPTSTSPGTLLTSQGLFQAPTPCVLSSGDKHVSLRA